MVKMIDDDPVGKKRGGGGDLTKEDEPSVGNKKGDQVGMNKEKNSKKVKSRQKSILKMPRTATSSTINEALSEEDSDSTTLY